MAKKKAKQLPKTAPQFPPIVLPNTLKDAAREVCIQWTFLHGYMPDHVLDEWTIGMWSQVIPRFAAYANRFDELLFQGDTLERIRRVHSQPVRYADRLNRSYCEHLKSLCDGVFVGLDCVLMGKKAGAEPFTTQEGEAIARLFSSRESIRGILAIWFKHGVEDLHVLCEDELDRAEGMPDPPFDCTAYKPGPVQRRLIELVSSEKRVTFNRAGDKVWGDDLKDPETIEKAVQRANESIKDSRFRIAVRSGVLYWE